MSRKQNSRSNNSEEEFEVLPRKQKLLAPVEAKTKNQQRYIEAIDSFPLTFGTGPAGVGKTFIAASMAAEALDAGETERIIITRPAVEAGESLGFLPGLLEEKYDPYLTPFKEVLEKKLGKSKVEYLIKTGVIEAAPLAYMRGRTFSDCWVILDEAQNTTPGQMKMFLTRIGAGATVVVNGDESQCDLFGPCGLTDAIRRVSYIPQIKIIRFDKEDVVRSGLAQEIVTAYEQTEQNDMSPPPKKPRVRS